MGAALAMDLDALMQQLNTVEPQAINWRALADSTSAREHPSPADPSQEPPSETSPRWVIEASLLDRLQAHLGPLSAEEQRSRISAILQEALDTWLQAHRA